MRRSAIHYILELYWISEPLGWGCVVLQPDEKRHQVFET